MVTEIAFITIDSARSAEFEAAVREAAPLFEAAQGCSAMRLERVVEDETQYRLVVQWGTVEDHMVTFRESDDFGKWRALAGPFFTEPPRVEHWESLGDHFSAPV